MGKHAFLAQILGQYAVNKANPAIGLAKETAMGHDYMGRALPWVHEKAQER
jgi:hypothetical protein